MADMYGALRSNWFKPVDVEKCKTFLTTEVIFGDDVEIFDQGDGRLALGGYEQYPNAYPMTPYDKETGDNNEWDLECFATAMRKHLQPGEEFRVFAAGHEKLCYVAATHLIVTHDTVTFNSYEEGD